MLDARSSCDDQYLPEVHDIPVRLFASLCNLQLATQRFSPGLRLRFYFCNSRSTSNISNNNSLNLTITSSSYVSPTIPPSFCIQLSLYRAISLLIIETVQCLQAFHQPSDLGGSLNDRRNRYIASVSTESLFICFHVSHSTAYPPCSFSQITVIFYDATGESARVCYSRGVQQCVKGGSRSQLCRNAPEPSHSHPSLLGGEWSFLRISRASR